MLLKLQFLGMCRHLLLKILFLQTQTLLSSVVALIALLSIGQIDLILAATYFLQCLILIVE